MLQVRKGAIGAKCGLMFAYNDSEAFDADKHFKRFKKYDGWDYKDYKEFVQDRYVTWFVVELFNVTLLLIKDLLITWTWNGACLGVRESSLCE